MKSGILLFLVFCSVQVFSQNCDMLQTQEDKNLNTYTWFTDPDLKVQFLKTVYRAENRSTMNISLYAGGKSILVGARGWSIHLANGKILSDKSKEIRVDAGNDIEFRYSVFIELTKDQIEALKSSPIKSYKLLNNEEVLSVSEQQKFQVWFNCVNDSSEK